MSNITAFYSKEDIHQQACEWISRIDRGLSDDETSAIVKWAALSEQHKVQLFEVAQLFDDLSALNELSGLFPLRAKESVRERTFSEQSRRNIAAGFAFLVLSSLSWVILDTAFAPSVVETAQITSAQTQMGEQKPITLPDGSVVHLNTDSLVTIHYSDDERRIRLDRGEAHFDVAHDESRPFIVEAGSNTVTAVGTAFNVELKDEQHFELLVTEGKVLVKDALQQQAQALVAEEHPLEGQGLLLVSGQKAIFDGKHTPAVELSLDQVQRDLAWQQGMVVFQGEPLEDALKEISRYSPVLFQIPDAKLKQKRVAGYFKAGDINGLLFALKNNFDIENVKIDDQTILLKAI